MVYKALIFDLDGTLLDTLEDIAAAANRVLETMNMPTHPVKDYRLFVGNGMESLLTKILPEQQRTPPTITKAVSRFQEDYSKNWYVKTSMYDGIAEMLNTVEAEGYPSSILSNKPEEFTRPCVEQLLPNWRFSHIFGQRQDVPKKPDPQAALEIARKLNLEPSDILFVGDSSVDMKTATNAGMDAVGVLWGFRSAEELRESGARYLIGHPRELLAILKN